MIAQIQEDITAVHYLIEDGQLENAEKALEELNEKIAKVEDPETKADFEKQAEAFAKAIEDAKGEEPADKSALEKAIEDATALKDEVAEDKKEALDAAIADAQKVLDNKEATEEEIADAVAELEAAMEAAKEDAEEEAIAVESVKANNETTVEVTVGDDVTEDDLLETTLTLTDKDDNTFTAKYVPGSLQDGEAEYDLEDNAKLVDAEKYQIASDDLALPVEEVTAKTKAPYAKTFEVVTTAVTATPTDSEATTKTIYFDAKDQYGNPIKVKDVKNVEATVKYNNLPLTVEQNAEANVTADAQTGQLVVTIDEKQRPLAEGAKLDIQLDVKADEEVIATSNASFTIEKGEAAVPTTLAAINATYVDAEDQEEGDKVTDVLPGNKIKLTADVKDQYGNPVTAAKENESLIRWVVKEGKDLVTITTPNSNDKSTVDTKDNVFAFTANKPGTLTIEAYNIANGDFKTYTVEIAASKLEKIDVDVTDKVKNDKGEALVNKTPYNNEENIVAVLEANPEGAALKAEDVKFDVKPGKDLTAEDITVTAEEITIGKGDKATKHIVVKATTKKAGTYTVTPFVGEAIDADKVAKGTAITVKTELNPTIESFTVEQVKENEVAVGKTVKKALTFVNKHGEEILPAKTAVKPTVVGGSTAQIFENPETKKLEVELKGTKEGNVTVTLVAGKAVQQLKFDVVGEAKVDKVNLGTNVTSGVVAGSKEEVVRPIEVKDQFGNDYIPASLGEIEIETDSEDTGLTAELQYYTIDEETEEVTVQDDADAQNENKKGVALVLNAKSAQNTKDEKVKVTAKAKDSDKELSSTTVTIKAKAALKEVTVEAKSTTLTVGGKTTVLVKPVDQYGNVVADLESKIAVTANDVVAKDGNATAVYHDKDGKVVDATDEGAKLVGYEVTVEGKKKGEVAAEFVVTEGTEPNAKTAKATQNFKVDSVGALVDTVEVKADKEVVNNSEEGAKATLTATGKDADGNEVQIADKDLTWSITSVKDENGYELDLAVDKAEEGTYKVTLKDAKGENTGTIKTVTIKNGELSADKDLTVEVEAQVRTANNKVAKTTVQFNGEDPKFVSGLTVATVGETDASELEDKGLVITFGKGKGEIETQKVNLTFSGIDQNGDIYPLKEAKDVIEVSSDDDTVAKVTATHTLTINAIDEGEATAYVNFGGETLEIKVIVKEDAATLAKAKTEAIEALKTAYPSTSYTKEENKAAYEEAMKQATDAINAATSQEAIDAVSKDTLKAIQTDAQLEQAAKEKEKNKQAANTALTKAVEAAEKVSLTNETQDVDQKAAEAAIETAIKNALKDGEDEFAGKVEVIVEEDGFTVATNATSETEAGTPGSIKFKITITVGEDDVAGTATSKEITLTITQKAHQG